MKAQPYFGLTHGRVITRNYRVDRLLGMGWEGEVYLVNERLTGAHRAAKLFYPHRNEKDRSATHYARKLERLKACEILIQYHHSEQIRLKGDPVTVLISEFVEGDLLSNLVASQRGKRMPLFEALHLTRTIAEGLSQIHERKEYHGDLHAGNILVKRRGIHFDVKLVDMYDWGRATKSHIHDDVCDVVRILYDMLGGQRHYKSQPDVVKYICGGLKKSLICGRFPTAWHLCRHLDTLEW
jgi:serine/threonine protein kinase